MAAFLANLMRYLPTILRLLPVAVAIVREIRRAIADDAKNANVIQINQPPGPAPKAHHERLAELHDAIDKAANGDWPALVDMYVAARERNRS